MKINLPEKKRSSAEDESWKRLRETAHEFRTPLSTILIAVEVLQKETAGSLTPEASRHLELIERNAERLSMMIDNALTLGSARKGFLTCRPADLEIKPFLDTFIGDMRPIFEDKGLALSLRLGEGIPTRFICDANLLHHVLTNLLMNACKFTPAGGAELCLERKDDSLCFIVSDSGIGIPKEEASKVFMEFYRAVNAEGEPGAGLGLALARRLAAVMNGSLSLSSDRGEGSTFTLTLPLKDLPDGVSPN